ncbi:MAG TPA: cbb3-type cytochrome c oxidase subunit 3 [Lysobacter sp.]|nr:cbb3-type cytochrome c oxidase subunit 3 [Lysobacter sp.]
MLSGIITIVLMLLFIGIWVWAWRPQNKQSFDETARLALDEGPDNTDSTAKGAGEPHA